MKKEPLRNFLFFLAGIDQNMIRLSGVKLSNSRLWDLILIRFTPKPFKKTKPKKYTNKGIEKKKKESKIPQFLKDINNFKLPKLPKSKIQLLEEQIEKLRDDLSLVRYNLKVHINDRDSY